MYGPRGSLIPCIIRSPFTFTVSRLFFNILIILQTVGYLGRVISLSQGLYLNTGQHKHRINAYTYQTSMPWVGFQPTIPLSERASEDHSAAVTGEYYSSEDSGSPSQWPRGLKHQLCSTAQTLRLWVRIPLWGMNVYVRLFCIRAVLCLQVEALWLADPPSKEFYRLCSRSRNCKAAKVQQRAVELYIYEYIG
jgi:hypothetical protein